ncbi:MAG TPA: hypothetical protein ENI85_13355, partial [Deltaproteobacteria bacterium]|nr:hypothetical protein [Deltaproteobacteria bacterium]
MIRSIRREGAGMETAGRASNDRVRRWAPILLFLSAFPAILIALGIDLGMPSAPVDDALLSSPAFENAHLALRGSFTHTLLEWTAVCFAAFGGMLALVQYRIVRDPFLPIIGFAFVCAGAMDAFHTFAADRLLEAVADNRDLIPFTWAICRAFNAMI